MKGRRAFYTGSGAGLFFGLIILTLSITPIYLVFSATLIILGYAFAVVSYCTVFGWPRRYIRFDFYDFSKFVIGFSSGVIFISLLTATAKKVALTFALGPVVATILTTSCFTIYLLAGFLLASIAKEGRQRG